MSTVAEAVPLLADVDVNVDMAWPDMIVPLVEFIVPCVAVQATASSGTNIVIEGTTLSEL